MFENKVTASKWLVLVSMIICLSMIFIDQTALPIALNNIGQTLHASVVEIQWFLNAYLLAIAAFIIMGGKLADLIGSKKIYIIGAVIFLVSSMLCGLSTTSLMLIIARALQGLSAAVMMPASSALLIRAFPFDERGKAMGIHIASASMFLALGPVIGGMITEYCGWQWIFWLNIPLILLSLLFLSAAKITQSEKAQVPSPSDLRGFVLQLFMIVPFIFAIMQAAELSWTSLTTLTLFAVSIASAIAFQKSQRQSVKPFLELHLFSQMQFRVCILFIVFTQVSIIAISFWPSLLQSIYGISPKQTSFLLLLVTAPVMMVSPIAGRLMDNNGPRLPVTLGCACIAAGALWLAFFMWMNDYRLIIPGFFIYGCGPAFLLIATMTHIMNSADPKTRGTIAGLVSFFRQLGGTVALAIFGSLIAHFYSHGTRSEVEILQSSHLQAFSGSLILIFLLAVMAAALLRFLPNYADEKKHVQQT